MFCTFHDALRCWFWSNICRCVQQTWGGAVCAFCALSASFCMYTYWAFICHVRAKSYLYTWQETGLTKFSLLKAVPSRHPNGTWKHGMARLLITCASAWPCSYDVDPVVTALRPLTSTDTVFLCFYTGLKKNDSRNDVDVSDESFMISV